MDEKIKEKKEKLQEQLTDGNRRLRELEITMVKLRENLIKITGGIQVLNELTE